MQKTIHRGDNSAESYKGIKIHAAPGVHEKVLEKVRQNLKEKEVVVDLGAGDGALSLRLKDAGLDVLSVDLDATSLKKLGLNWIEKDLDDISSMLNDVQNLKAVCAVELIEHLENPRKFIRDIIPHVKANNGIFIITTPNPLDNFSAISVFTRGIFNWFGPQHYFGGGHISILPYWLISYHLIHAGVPEDKISIEFLSPYKHPGAIKGIVYSFIGLLRKIFSKSVNVDYHQGQSALIIVDFT